MITRKLALVELQLLGNRQAGLYNRVNLSVSRILRGNLKRNNEKLPEFRPEKSNINKRII